MAKYNSLEGLFHYINFDRMEPINFTSTYPITLPVLNTPVYEQEDAKSELDTNLRNPKDDELATKLLND